MNNVCSYFTSRHKSYHIINNDSLCLKSKVNLDHINTTSTNLVTVVNSYTTDYQQNNNSRRNSFTSIDNQLPSSLPPHPIINTITILPKIWRKKDITKYKPIIYDNINEDLHLFKSFGKCVKCSS